MKELTTETKNEIAELLKAIKAETEKTYSSPCYIAEKLETIKRRVKYND